MNSKRSFSPALAMIALSAHTSTHSRTDFADSNPLGNNYIGNDEGGEGGGDSAVNTDTSVAGTGASTEEQQQSQQQAQADSAPQADASETSAGQQAQAVGDPPAGTDQQT